MGFFNNWKDQRETQDSFAQAGEGLKRGFRKLRGKDNSVRTCPECHRKVGFRQDSCPLGHYVGYEE